MAVGGSGSRVAWVGATCVLVGGALVYALRGAHGPLGVSDRSGLVSMVVALPALVASVVGLLWARSGAHEDETAAVARLVREVRSVGEPQWMHSLGGELTPIDVTFAFRPYAHARAAELPPTPAGQLERVVEDYRAVRPRRLVITGEPGAGKTVLARKLVMELNKARQAGEQVAVLMALADWDTREALADWVVRHLERDFGMPRRSARKVMDARMVLPVLDGLDEMDAADVAVADARARHALEALALHQDGADPAPLVLTCRTRTYDDLEAEGSHILDAARIEIHPVDPARAVAFLERRGAARRPALWRPVLDELRTSPDGVLAAALSTPWRLTLAATVYERQGDPGELSAKAASGSADQVAELLLSRFVGAVARNTPKEAGRYAEGVIHARLHLLAVGLGAGNTAETDLVLHRLGERVAGTWRAVVRIGALPGVVLPVLFLVREPADSVAWIDLGLGCACNLVAWHWSDDIGLALVTGYSAPPLGSPLWRLGFRRLAHTFLRRFPTYAILYLLLYGIWQALLAVTGGGGGFTPLVPAVAAAVAGWVLGGVSMLDSTAVGPVGPVRAGWLWCVLGTAVLGSLLASRGSGSDTWLSIALMPAFALVNLRAWVGYLTYRLANPRLGPRLPAFLDWCVTAGLLRTSGIAYQFRHREFQEWLVRHPRPVT
ncbi:NACHT domain-containing NTPase [Streptomyces sp. Act143]|uniref:NACHT domain-containing protein n=1 Tax=Streptomyces sp. Act143 TaxID=2200760 RepID=UPI0015E823FE|nr:NACHT domain-containing protein [Streptomyces sp. Act143]